MERYIKLLKEAYYNIKSVGDPLGFEGKQYIFEVGSVENPEYYLFTGREYYIAGIMHVLFKHYSSVALGVRSFLKRLGLEPIKLFTRNKVVLRFKDIPAKLVRLLRKLGCRVDYIPDYDLYSGTLLLEHGFVEELEQHVNKILSKFQKYNIKNVIVVSPHALEILKIFSQKALLKYPLHVVHYTEVLVNLGIESRSSKVRVAFHDPCHLARSMGIMREPRILIERCGATLIEPRYSQKLTNCCGAPLEYISPHLSREIARRRLDELKSLNIDVVVTACPFCLSALLSVATEDDPGIVDLIEFLYERM